MAHPVKRRSPREQFKPVPGTSTLDVAFNIYLIGVEFGHAQCEKGDNLQVTLARALLFWNNPTPAKVERGKKRKHNS